VSSVTTGRDARIPRNDDSDLVRAAQHGDQRAFAQLVEKYEARVYNLARKMMRDPQDAEDVLQETFLSVFRHLNDFHGDSSFSTWLYRIATNAALMKLRAQAALAFARRTVRVRWR